MQHVFAILTPYLCSVLLALNPAWIGCSVNGGRDVEASGGSELLEGLAFDVFNGVGSKHFLAIRSVWQGEYSCFNRPTSAYPGSHPCIASAFCADKEVYQFAINAVNSDDFVFSHISALLLVGGPPAILGCIVTIYVDPVNAMVLRGSHSHYGKELLERLESKTNTPSTVVFEPLVGCQIAPVFRRSINGVLGSFFAGRVISSRSNSAHFLFLTGFFALQASAAFDSSRSHGISALNLNASTRAFCVPAVVLFLPISACSRIAQNTETVGRYPCSINENFTNRVWRKYQFAFLQYTHYKSKRQNPPNELLLHNEGQTWLIQLKGGFRNEDMVSKSNPLCSPAKIRIKNRYNSLKTNKLTLL